MIPLPILFIMCAFIGIALCNIYFYLLKSQPKEKGKWEHSKNVHLTVGILILIGIVLVLIFY